jgi:SRSO17 transposase
MVVRQDGECGEFPIPKFTVDEFDVEGFMEELKGFHAAFADCFSRSEPRENLLLYIVGQFSALERKSIEPMALTVEGGNVRSLQRFVSNVTWDEKKMLHTYHGLVSEDMGHANGVLIFDESAFPKKGGDSAGVSRQYSGIAGKIDNCQVGVFAAYASPHGYALLDKRLFMPEKWFSDTHQEKRIDCRLPDDAAFKTKPALAAEMLHTIHREGILPFRYVVADSFYGRNHEFRDAVEAYIGVTYFVSVPSDTLCWIREPVVEKKKYRYGGEVRSKKLLREKEKPPVAVEVFARSINKYFWYRRVVAEGAKGPIAYEFTKRRVTLSKEGLPEETVWLVIRRTLGDHPVYSYYMIPEK